MKRPTQSSLPTLRTALSIFIASLFAAGTLHGNFASAASGELEREIEAALQHQENMLRSRDPGVPARRAPSGQTLQGANLSERIDFRSAPLAPVLRKLPAALFESEQVEISAGYWDNRKTLTVIRRTLDVDRDGTPEQIRYFNPSDGALIRREADLNYDGKIDLWEQFTDGSVVERRIDTNANTRVDVWEKYRAGRMSERTLDRNADGAKDAYFSFTGDSLTEEKHDRNYDRRIDMVVTYRDRRKVESREDRNDNGHFDTWTYYERIGEEDVMNRIERDSNDSGEIDFVETFDTSSGKPVLLQRKEDKDGDGEIDITSIYRNGKLYRREFSDPNLMQ